MSQTWTTFIPLFVSTYVASTFTPSQAIALSRIQVQSALAPTGCSRNAVVRVSDGTTAGTRTVTIAAATNDSGALSINYAAGVPVTVSVSVTAACTIPPASATVVVQYRAQ